jgi:ABC-type branched-subunit amino acid transport system ATPase component
MLRTFQLTATFDNLSVLDNLVLAFFRAHRKSGLLQMLLNTRRRFYKEPRIIEALETFSLANYRDRLVKHLSLGEKRRLDLEYEQSKPPPWELPAPVAKTQLEYIEWMKKLTGQ